ncbi:MAG: PA14 domain-containing protein, partial [Limisphaerales bacterium]
MRRENKNTVLPAASFFFGSVAGFFFAVIFVPSLLAQPAIPSELPSGIPVLATNLQQLSELLGTSPRMIADVNLDVLVCAASRAEIGAVAVTDKTGSELLELGPRGAAILPGEIIHIEGRGCLLRRREIGIEITKAPDLDDDGVHALHQVSAEVNLTAGPHPFQLDSFNLFGGHGLDLTCRLPDGSVQAVERFLARPGGEDAVESNMVAGLTGAYYEGYWLNVPDFPLLEPVKIMTTTNFNPIPGRQRALSGIRFNGFFSAPMSGKYTFTLESDDGSLLFLDSPEIPLAMVGHKDVPSPNVSSLHAPMADAKAPQWMSVEGRVDFVSRMGKGLRFELRSQPDSIWVMVADDQEPDAERLLNSRIRVTGVGRAVMAPNRDRVLGELSAATSDEITILQESAGVTATSGSAPTLTTVEQIQSLTKEEAARHLPVTIQGVVTSLVPGIFHYMSVQDETRGIFVSPVPSAGSAAIAGQFCVVTGYTDAGDFAPMVVAREVVVLGKGQMPPPARPTWNELINGSMDAQWVELQGLVTAVQTNTLALLLPEGEVQIDAEAYSESQLKTFVNAEVRIRGALFAIWNTNRTVQVGHLLMRNVMIDIDAPAPSNPFDAPLKRWGELYQFDSRATPFQRVKVRGTVIYADSRRVFIMDMARGICVLPVESTNVEFGEEVEVVGYPDITGPAPVLRESILRKTGRKDAPPLRISDGSEWILDNADSTLVRISATLMGMHSEQDSRVLEMNAHGHLFFAYLPDTEESASLRIGSQLALTGVYVEKSTRWSQGGNPNGFELLLESPAQ